MSTDNSSARIILADMIGDVLRRAGQLPPGTVITRCVAVVQTLSEVDGRPDFQVHRVYPMGPTDPSGERGILADALARSEHERDDR